MQKNILKFFTSTRPEITSECIKPSNYEVISPYVIFDTTKILYSKNFHITFSLQ